MDAFARYRITNPLLFFQSVRDERIANSRIGAILEASLRRVLGSELQPCSFDPMTGYYRTGCCENHGDDPGLHVVCVVLTDEHGVVALVHAGRLQHERGMAERGVDVIRLLMKQGHTPFGVEMKITDDANKTLPWDGTTFGRLVFGVSEVVGHLLLERTFQHRRGNRLQRPVRAGDVLTAAPGGTHRAACEAAAAYVMAQGNGTADKLEEWLFANQPEMTPESVRQAARDESGRHSMENTMYDLAQAARALRSQPGFTLLAVLLFTLLNAVFHAGTACPGSVKACDQGYPTIPIRTAAILSGVPENSPSGG